MKHPRLVLPLFLRTTAGLWLAGCGDSGPDVFAEAEVLEGQGKLEEAAAKLELTCAYAPRDDLCNAADGRAAEARTKAAEKAMGDGDFARAERLFTRATVTADDATAKRVSERLASDDLAQGLAYQRALARADRRDVAEAMAAIAATKAPVAVLAKAWLDKERPGLVLDEVKAACGPSHEGSCSKAAAALKAAALTGPEADLATALAEAEERRVYALRVNAEGLRSAMAALENRDILLDGVCSSPGYNEFVACDVQGGHDTTPEDAPDTRYQKHKALAVAWHRTLRSIGDPELVAELETRKQRRAPAIGVPKPRPAPKQDPKK